MPIKIIQRSHREIVGEGVILLTSPPTTSSMGALYTGEIVEEAALLSKAHALIENQGKYNSDSLSSDIMAEFDATKSTIVDDFGIRMEFAIIGRKEIGIEAETVEFAEDDVKIIELIKEIFQTDFHLKINSGQNLNQENGPKKPSTVRLLLGPEERGLRKDTVVAKIAVLVGLMNAAFRSSESDERARGVLD
jgi:hypothetical protein